VPLYREREATKSFRIMNGTYKTLLHRVIPLGLDRVDEALEAGVYGNPSDRGHGWGDCRTVGEYSLNRSLSIYQPVSKKWVEL
jgi:hypothetical protein